MISFILIALAYNYTVAQFGSGAALFYQLGNVWVGKLINNTSYTSLFNISASHLFAFNNGSLWLVVQNSSTYLCKYSSLISCKNLGNLPQGQIYFSNSTLYIQQGTTVYAYKSPNYQYSYQYSIPCAGKFLGVFENQPVEYCFGTYYLGFTKITSASLFNSIPQILENNKIYSATNSSFLFPSDITPLDAMLMQFYGRNVIVYYYNNQIYVQYGYSVIRSIPQQSIIMLSGVSNNKNSLYIFISNASGIYFTFQPLGVDIPIAKMFEYNNTYVNISWNIPYAQELEVTLAQLTEYVNGQIVYSEQINFSGSKLLKKVAGMQVIISDLDPFGQASTVIGANISSIASSSSSSSTTTHLQSIIVHKSSILLPVAIAVIAIIAVFIIFRYIRRKQPPSNIQAVQNTQSQTDQTQSSIFIQYPK